MPKYMVIKIFFVDAENIEDVKKKADLLEDHQVLDIRLLGEEEWPQDLL